MQSTAERVERVIYQLSIVPNGDGGGHWWVVIMPVPRILSKAGILRKASSRRGKLRCVHNGKGSTAVPARKIHFSESNDVVQFKESAEERDAKRASARPAFQAAKDAQQHIERAQAAAKRARVEPTWPPPGGTRLVPGYCPGLTATWPACDRT